VPSRLLHPDTISHATLEETMANHFSFTSHSLILAAFLFAIVPCGTLEAQRSQQSEVARRVAVTLAVTDDLTDGSVGALILRRPASVSPSDVILLDRSRLTPRLLEDAIRMLLVDRVVSGDTSLSNMALRVPVPTQPQQTGPGRWARERGRSTQICERLVHAQAVDLAGIGQRQAITIYLPPGLKAGRVFAKPK